MNAIYLIYGKFVLIRNLEYVSNLSFCFFNICFTALMLVSELPLLTVTATVRCHLESNFSASFTAGDKIPGVKGFDYHGPGRQQVRDKCVSLLLQYCGYPVC